MLTGRAPGALDRRAERGEADPARAPPTSPSAFPPTRCASARTCAPPSAASPPPTARIGVAEAQLYPGLRLTGNIGTSAFSLGGLFNAITGGIFAGLDQTLFDGGRLRSQLRSQRAATEGALATYHQSVLTSLEDVENALIALDAARARQVQFAIALEAATNTALLARTQYRSGLTDFQQLLEAERSLALRARRHGRQPRRRGACAGPALSCPGRRLGSGRRAPDRKQLMNEATQTTVTNEAGTDKKSLEVFLGAPAAKPWYKRPALHRRAGRARPRPAARCRAASPARPRAAMRPRRCGAAICASPSPRPAISSRPTRSRSAPSNPASSPRCSSTITTASRPASRSPGSTRRGCRTRSSRRRPASPRPRRRSRPRRPRPRSARANLARQEEVWRVSNHRVPSETELDAARAENQRGDRRRPRRAGAGRCRPARRSPRRRPTFPRRPSIRR